MKALMTLGRLQSIEVYDPKTKKSSVRRYRGKWLTSSPNGKTLHICTVTKKKSNKPIPETIKKAHKKFHGKAEKENAWEGDCPRPSGRTTMVGYIKALTYSVPRSIKSPGKNPYYWNHLFGDTGHAGGERKTDYPPKYYPALYKDTKGNLFIRRRSGNIWKVTDWIIG